MIKYYFLGVFIFLLSSCSVNFSSDQLTSIKRLLKKERHELLDKQWVILYEGKYHEAYAIIYKKGYRVLSLEHLEIDFKATSITELRVPTPIQYNIAFAQTVNGFKFIDSRLPSSVSVKCSDLRPITNVLYTQQCSNQELDWNYENQLQVNEQREIVFIKTYYSPSKPPIELYYSQLFNELKKSEL